MKALLMGLIISVALFGEGLAETPLEKNGKKRRVFIGISIESGGMIMNADRGRYNYDPGLLIGGSIEVGREPFALELGGERDFNMTPHGRVGTILGSPNASIEETGAHISFIRMKCRMVRLKQFQIWLGAGINFLLIEHKWISKDTTGRWYRFVNREFGLGGHWQGLFSVKKWTASELSIAMKYRIMGEATADPFTRLVPSDYKIRSISVKWTYFLYESAH